MTPTDYTSILRYDRMVLDSKTFSAEKKWSISQERSISLGDRKRQSYLSEKTKQKLLQIFNRINN